MDAIIWKILFSFQLENGGDMAFQADFNTQAVRFGLMLTQVSCEELAKLSGRNDKMQSTESLTQSSRAILMGIKCTAETKETDCNTIYP